MLRAVLAAFLAAAVAGSRPGVPVSPLSANEVLSVDGGQLTSNGRPVRAGFFAPSGAILRLSDGARAVVRVGGAGVMGLKGPASIRFLRGRRGVDLLHGRVLAVLPRVKREVEFRARSVFLSASGGVFFVEAGGGRETYLCVCRGALEVREASGHPFRVNLSSSSHRPFLFRSSSQGILQVEAEVKDHDDSEIAELEGLLKG